jgi:hypothetical protein
MGVIPALNTIPIVRANTGFTLDMALSVVWNAPIGVALLPCPILLANAEPIRVSMTVCHACHTIL